jgi:hypothetical protein
MMNLCNFRLIARAVLWCRKIYIIYSLMLEDSPVVIYIYYMVILV